MTFQCRSAIKGASIGMCYSLLVACMGSAHYQAAPRGAIEHGTGPAPVHSDKYKVESNRFPKYVARQDFVPPAPAYCGLAGCVERPRVQVTKNHIWEVTHVVAGRYIIQSKTYNEVMSKRARGYIPLDFGIYITPAGAIDGGWELFKSRAVGAEKQKYFSPDPRNNAEWPRGAAFEVYEK